MAAYIVAAIIMVPSGMMFFAHTYIVFFESRTSMDVFDALLLLVFVVSFVAFWKLRPKNTKEKRFFQDIKDAYAIYKFSKAKEDQRKQTKEKREQIDDAVTTINKPNSVPTVPSPMGIAGMGLSLLSFALPYFAAVFFAPAGLVCSYIAIAKGDKTYGRIGVVLGSLGTYLVIKAMKEIEKMLGA